MKSKGRKRVDKDRHSENWCFSCKDGGDLLICDHRDCLKSYHPRCVGLGDSVVNAETQFICRLHKCDVCNRASDIQCYCCPKGLCIRCIKTENFVHVRKKKGFCGHCLKLALLVEQRKDVDSDGERIDFNNLDTYETLYKEYWQIINTTEKLTLESLISFNAQLKSGKKYNSDSYDDSDDDQISDFEEIDDKKSHVLRRKRKRSKDQKGKSMSKRIEFTGWGSKNLMKFLGIIGEDTTHSLSQRELEIIMKKYIKNNKLLKKNKTVECDIWLQSIFGRKTVKINRIFDLLEPHLAENRESSEEDEIEQISERKDDEKLVVYTRKNKDDTDKLLEKEKEVLDINCFRFAAIVPENIKLVYLRRTLVQKFEKERGTFESKVKGSFVRVKPDANGYFSNYQLMQVTGIRKCFIGENDQNVVLQASDLDISINALSDDDFSTEECDDLRNKIKSGLLKKIELVALEEKSRSLHKDIMNHWIPHELALLKQRIDHANEKGWRRELFEYLERMKFLENPSNQIKLLEQVPTVVPDVIEVGSIGDCTEDNEKVNKDLQKSDEIDISQLPFENLKGHEERQNNSKASAVKGQTQRSSSFVDQKTSKFQELIELDSDDDDEKSTIDLSKEELQDTESSIWYVRSSDGENRGPFSLSVLKSWSHTCAALKSKIFKESQHESQAMPLIAVVHLAFSRK